MIADVRMSVGMRVRISVKEVPRSVMIILGTVCLVLSLPFCVSSFSGAEGFVELETELELVDPWESDAHGGHRMTACCTPCVRTQGVERTS